MRFEKTLLAVGVVLLSACRKEEAKPTPAPPPTAVAVPAPTTAPAPPTVSQLAEMVRASEASYDECQGPPRKARKASDSAPPAQSREEAKRRYEEASKQLDDAMKAVERDKKCWDDFAKAVGPKLKEAGASDKDAEAAMTEWFRGWNDRRAKAH